MVKQRAAVIIINENKLLFMKRKKNAKEYYATIGETIEIGETPHEAAVREVKEETNLTVEIDNLLWEFKDEFHVWLLLLGKIIFRRIKTRRA